MASDINEIILRFTGDEDDAQSSLVRLAAALEAIDDEDANPEVHLKGEGELLAAIAAIGALLDAVDNQEISVSVEEQTSLNRLMMQLKVVDDENPTPTVGLTGDEKVKTDLGELGAALGEFDQVDVKPEVKLSGKAGVAAEAAETAALLAALDAQDVEVDIEIHRDEDSIGKLRQVGSAILGLVTSSKEGSSAVGGLGVNFGPFTAALNPATAGIIALALAIGISLVAALGTLVASATAAVGAIGALGTSFLAALGPAVVLIIGVVMRLAKVLDVLKAEDAAQEDANKKSIQGDKARVISAQQRQAAALALSRAEDQLGQATVAAYREMEDAAERARDAVLSLEAAQLGQERAGIAIERAQLELKKFREEMGLTGAKADTLFKEFDDVGFDPTKLNKALEGVGVKAGTFGEEQELRLKELVLGVKDARLGEKQALDSVGDATTELSRAQAENARFQRMGIAASQQYTSALRAVRDAEMAVARARASQDTAAITAAQATVAAKTAQLTGVERQLLGVIKQLRVVFHQTFGPGVQAIIMGIVVALGLIRDRIAPLRGAFTILGRAMGGALVQITKILTSPAMIKSFQQLTLAAARLAGPISVAFAQLLVILLNIARAAMPFLLRIVTAVALQFTKWASSTANMTTMRGVIATLVMHLRLWWKVFGAISRAFIAFFPAVLPFAAQLLRYIIRVANGLAAWAKSNAGRDQIKEFLRVAIPAFIALVRFVGRLIVFFLRAAQIALPFFTRLLNLISKILKIFTNINRVVAFFAIKLDKLFGYIISPFERALDWLDKKLEAFNQIGSNIMDSLWKGLEAKARAVYDSITGVAGNIKKRFKEVFSIGSPSKVFFDYGVDISRGLENGLRARVGQLDVAANASLATPVLNARVPAPRPAAAAGGGGAGGGGTVIENQTVNFPQSTTSDPEHQAARFARALRRRGRG